MDPGCRHNMFEVDGGPAGKEGVLVGCSGGSVQKIYGTLRFLLIYGKVRDSA